MGNNPLYKLAMVFLQTAILALIIGIQPVKATVFQTPFYVKPDPITQKKICLDKKLQNPVGYRLFFSRDIYQKSTRNSLEPNMQKAGPQVYVTSEDGFINGLVQTYRKSFPPSKDPTTDLWTDDFSFKPFKTGKAVIKFKASYGSYTSQATLEFEVEKCKYKVEISADESGMRLASGLTFNQAQQYANFVIFEKGSITGVQTGEQNAQKNNTGLARLVAKPPSISSADIATGTMNCFGDAIYLGGLSRCEAAGTRGPLICQHEFTVEPESQENGLLNLTIEMLPGQCGSFTVWGTCDGQTSEYTVPPLKTLRFTMNVSVSSEGGTTHYIRQLPHGVTLDFLITAYPDDEED